MNNINVLSLDSHDKFMLFFIHVTKILNAHHYIASVDVDSYFMYIFALEFEIFLCWGYKWICRYYQDHRIENYQKVHSTLHINVTGQALRSLTRLFPCPKQVFCVGQSFPVAMVRMTITIREYLESISKDLSCWKIALPPFEWWKQVANCTTLV